MYRSRHYWDYNTKHTSHSYKSTFHYIIYIHKYIICDSIRTVMYPFATIYMYSTSNARKHVGINIVQSVEKRGF